MKRLLLTAALALSAFQGCTCHSTDSTEVGVLTRKVALIGEPGVQNEIYPPGATYLFMPLITDWNTYDISVQNLSMVLDRTKGDRSSADDLEFKTIDGNEIGVDVTVVWQIDPQKAPHILTSVGEDTGQVKEKLVRPACRSIVRDVLNELSSEDFYVADKRFQKADQARDQLQKVLAPEGVRIQQVILGGYRFKKLYEDAIHDKKLAEQNAEKLRSEAHAAAEAAKQKLETAKGKVQQQLAEAAGALDQAKLGADAAYFENQKRAEAIVAEKKAAAEAIRKKNEAMAGSGGRTMVKLKLAEALEGKQILFVPTGGGGAQLQTLNLNALLKTYGAEEEAKSSKVAGETPP